MSYFDDDFQKACQTDRQRLIENGRKKIDSRQKQVSQLSEKDIKEEIRRLRTEDENLSDIQLRILAEDNLLRKLSRKEELRIQKEQDDLYIKEHNDIFEMGSRNDFPVSSAEKDKYFRDSFRLAKKTHVDKKAYSETEIKLANRFLQDLLSPYGTVVVNIKNEKQDVFCSFNISADKIAPKKASTITLAEALLNIGTVEGTDVFIRPATFFYNKNKKFDENTICNLYNMVIDIDDCPVSDKTRWDAESYVFKKYPMLQVIKPDYIVDTGNKGVHIVFLFSDNVATLRNKFNIISKLVGEILHADMSKCTLNSSTRMPFTKNSKGQKSRIIYRSNRESRLCPTFEQFSSCVLDYAKSLYQTYDGYIGDLQFFGNLLHISDEEELKQHLRDDLEEGTLTRFYDDFKEKYGYDNISIPYINAKKEHDGVYQSSLTLAENTRRVVNDYSKHPKIYNIDKYIKNITEEEKKLSPFQIHLNNRLFDLEEFAKRHEYNFPGYRNNFMALYCAALFLKHVGKEEVWRKMNRMNENFGYNALRQSELRGTYNWALKQINANHFYKLRYSDTTMADMLGLDENDFIYMKNRYTALAKKKHKTEQNQAYNKKRSRKCQEHKEKKAALLKKSLHKYAKQDKKHIVANAAKEVNISIATAYRYIAEFGLLDNIENENNKSIERKPGFVSVAKRVVEKFKTSFRQYVANYASLVLLNNDKRVSYSIFVTPDEVLRYRYGLIN